ncbi:hypothetical protein QBE54_07990 [Thermatribacter velox]|jgi:hypothetical protein|uniref:Uncharacterized protein n=1 Tax=Thermatribacter velox TaxID=3039681 RepID=A0ABZ2YCV0_9BACT
MRKAVFLTVLFFCLATALSAEASVSYDLANEVIGNPEAFPLERSFVEEKLGKADFVESVAGFPQLVDYYLVEDGEEISHICLAYGAGDDAQKTYAVGVVMRGIDLPTMKEIFRSQMGEDADQAVILESEDFLVLNLVGQSTPRVLWVLFDERTVQGEKALVSTLIPPENLISYFAGVYPGFEASLRETAEELLKE